MGEGEGGLKEDSQFICEGSDPWVEQEDWLQAQLTQGHTKRRQKQCSHSYSFSSNEETEFLPTAPIRRVSGKDSDWLA